MPAISKIRLCNILYENGKKRYNDQLFHLDGQNTAILLENGGGKTVFIQTLLQCIIPHISMADRKIKDTLYLENGPAHIAIEWILQDQPRRYGLTCVTLYLENASLNSLKYAYEYSGEEREDIEALPFKVELSKNTYRPATKGEIGDYYQKMTKVSTYAKVFSTIQDYGSYLENNFKIVPSEWRKVATINSGEGNVDEFFNRCKTTAQLLDYLLLPVVAEAMEGDYHQRFAETFEKQREHFQKNRVLNEKIEQASMVKEEINSYIDIYKKYVKTQEESGFLLGKARAQYEFVEEKIRLLQQEKDSLIGEKEAIAEMRKEQLAREISYKLFEIDERMEEYDQKISLLEEQLTKLLLQRDQAASRRQNIQITKINQLVKEMEGEIQRLKVEIAIEEKNMPAEDLLKQLEENSSHIKGHFFYELEKLETEIVKNKQRMNEKSEKSTQVKGRLEGFTLKKDGLTEQIHRLQAVRNFLQEKMDQIYDGLFEEEIGRQMDQEAKGWLKQKAEIEAQIKQSEMEEYRFGQEIEELHQEV
ncbi:MAG: hypothetical protein JW708_11210, partial [Vallitaleaceae bacterium]|nr:hypothetical protein [Vallitaleaceae bacterium]